MLIDTRSQEDSSEPTHLKIVTSGGSRVQSLQLEVLASFIDS